MPEKGIAQMLVQVHAKKLSKWTLFVETENWEFFDIPLLGCGLYFPTTEKHTSPIPR